MNKFKKILMIGYSEKDLGKKEWDRIKTLSDRQIILPKDDPDIVSHLASTDCLLVKLGATVDKQMINSAPNLRYIGMFGTGFGRINVSYATQRSITVCNIAGYSTQGVAELAFGVLIKHIRGLERAKLQARNGDFSEATFQGYEIRGKNLGVIGLGRIGTRIAKIAHNGFGARVSYWSRNRKPEIEMISIDFKEIKELLKNSDFLSINLAYVPETKNFLNKERIELIKKGAVVVNLSPMELVDIDALEQRLKKNDITFILDHADELTQKQAKQLRKYKNCIFYPPISYITKEATQAKLGMFIDNIENFLKGTPTSKVN